MRPKSSPLLSAIVLLSVATLASAQSDIEKRIDDLERRVKALEMVQQQAPPLQSINRDRALLTWTDRIRGKIRANIILPQDIPGNPEAIFDITILPSGEVVTVRMTKSSGHSGYDDAVERAIMNSSPLPKPDDPSLFQRQLRIAFRPR